jgi:uncharacterized protein
VTFVPGDLSAVRQAWSGKGAGPLPHTSSMGGCHGNGTTGRGRVPGQPADRGDRSVAHAAGHGSNLVYKRLRDRGYEVFAVNPNADQVEGDRCYPDLRSIPGGVEAVVIGTRPERAEATMRECRYLGITRVWMHRLNGPGSVSTAATDYGRQHGITVIDGGCPWMFGRTADPGHKVARLVFTLAGQVPRCV